MDEDVMARLVEPVHTRDAKNYAIAAAQQLMEDAERAAQIYMERANHLAKADPENEHAIRQLLDEWTSEAQHLWAKRYAPKVPERRHQLLETEREKKKRALRREPTPYDIWED